MSTELLIVAAGLTFLFGLKLAIIDGFMAEKKGLISLSFIIIGFITMYFSGYACIVSINKVVGV